MLRFLIKATFWMAFGILMGRLAGFFRESLIAYRFGVTESADISVLILTIPDLLISLLVGGALSVILIPEFKQLDQKRSWGLFIQSSCLVACASIFVTLIASVYASHIIHFIAPGVDFSVIQETQTIFRIVLWVIPLTALAGVSTAYLQARDEFFITAFSTLIFNSVIIISLVAFTKNSNLLLWFGVFIILGGLFRWLSQLIYLFKYYAGFRLFKAHWFNRALLMRYLQALLAGGFTLFLPYIAKAYSSYAGIGGIAIFNYATKLVELPLGVCITIFSIVIYPKLAEAFAEKEGITRGKIILIHGIRIVFFLSMALMMILILFNRDISSLVYGHGSMTAPILAEIGIIASIGFLSLPFQGISSLTIAAFNSKRDTFTPFYISLTAIIIFVPLAYLLRKLFGLCGLMSAVSLMYFYITIAQVALFKLRHQISIWKELLDYRTLCSLTSMFCIFIPAALIIHILHANEIINIVFALLLIPLLLMGTMAADSECRNMIINFIRK